jgi:DNA-binding SARP family transcriptional activator
MAVQSVRGEGDTALLDGRGTGQRDRTVAGGASVFDAQQAAQPDVRSRTDGIAIYLLGPFEVRLLPHQTSVQLPPASRDLLAYLALRRPRPVPREVVQERLWGDCSTEVTRRRLNTAVWRLRRSLGTLGGTVFDVIDTTAGGGIRLTGSDAVWVDSEAFEAAVRSNGGEASGRTPTDKLEDCIELYRGELVEGSYAEYLLADRARLAQLYDAALRTLILAHHSRGAWERTIELAEQLLDRDPLREDIHRLLIDVYTRADQRNRALAQFHRCRDLLARELSVDPMPETVRAAARAAGVAHLQTTQATDLLALLSELDTARRELHRVRDDMAALAASVDLAVRRLQDHAVGDPSVRSS